MTEACIYCAKFKFCKESYKGDQYIGRKEMALDRLVNMVYYGEDCFQDESEESDD